jgi:hypothetical protein
MRKCLAVFGLMFLAVIARAGDDFLSQLSPADFTAAGLQKQTPEELARLKALIEQYKSGELAEVQRAAAAQARLAQQEADRKVVAAETKAREAETKAQAAEAKAKETEEGRTATEPAKKQPGWFRALLTLKHASEKPEKEQPLESNLVGDFSGWHGQTYFVLEDGTRWRQQNSTEHYDYSPVLHAPRVKIKPAVISGFWLEIEGVNLSVRVVPVDLPGTK